MDPLDISWDFSNRICVEPQTAKVLIDQDRHSVLTINQPAAENSVIWLGMPALSLLRDSAYWRQLFFRSLLCSLGYLVLPNVHCSHRVEIEIDDWGTADKGFLSYWRYLEPSEDTLRHYLIAPLERHHAVVAANVIPGYVDRKEKRIVTPGFRNSRTRMGYSRTMPRRREALRPRSLLVCWESRVMAGRTCNLISNLPRGPGGRRIWPEKARQTAGTQNLRTTGAERRRRRLSSSSV